MRLAPAGTPDLVLARLGQGLSVVLARPEVRAIFLNLGSQAEASTPAAFSALIASERAKWGGIIRQYGIKP